MTINTPMTATGTAILLTAERIATSRVVNVHPGDADAKAIVALAIEIHQAVYEEVEEER